MANFLTSRIGTGGYPLNFGTPVGRTKIIYSASLASNPATLATLLEEIPRIRDAGFNTIGLGINTNGNGVFYLDPRFAPSYTSMRDPAITTAYEAITPYIDAAHEAGLRVFAWVELIRGGSVRADFAPAGTPAGNYNHFLPQYRDWVCGYLEELLTRYPGFDGVDLGEAFNWPTIYGNGGAGAWETHYAATTGRNYAADWTVFTTGGYVEGGDDGIRDWMAGSARQFVEQMANTIRRSAGAVFDRPVGFYGNLCSAIDVISGERTQAWVNSGVLDYVNVPIYGDVFSTVNLTRALQGVTDVNGVKMPPVYDEAASVVTINNYLDSLSRPLTGAELTSKLDALHAVSSTCGIGVYFYKGGSTLWLDDAQVRALSAWFLNH